MGQKEIIYESPFPDIYVPNDLSYSQFICSRNPDDVAEGKVIYADLEEPHASVTYAGLRQDAAKHAAWLRNQGLKPGDTVAMYATNSVA